MPLQRVYTDLKQRKESFYNPLSSALWSEISGVHRDVATLAEAIGVCDTPVLTILPDEGNKYPKVENLLSIPGVALGRYAKKKESFVFKYQGKPVHMYPLKVWFTQKPGNNLKEAIKGKKLLQEVIEKGFQPVGVHHGTREALHIPLLATPAYEGLTLLQHSLPFDKVYECPPEFDKALNGFTVQGRIEQFYHGQDSLDNLHYYDGRLMYASCLRRVPTGKMLHDTVNEFMPFVPGFYRVTVTVPENWHHIGLFVKINQQGPNTYPNKPGVTFETWASYPEMRLALKQGWKTQIHERFLWPLTEKEPEPLKQWGEKLVHLRMDIAEKYPEPYKGYLQEALRNTLLHTIGVLGRSLKRVDHTTKPGELPPEDAEGEILLGLTDAGEELYGYETTEELTAYQKIFHMPQWGKHIWGEARAKIAEKALEVPFEALVALRIDGIWTNCEMSYPDNGKVGQFRRKPVKEMQGLKWPRKYNEMLKLVAQARG